FDFHGRLVGLAGPPSGGETASFPCGFSVDVAVGRFGLWQPASEIAASATDMTATGHLPGHVHGRPMGRCSIHFAVSATARFCNASSAFPEPRNSAATITRPAA